MKDVHIGLDISTSVIGISILDPEGELFDLRCIKFNSNKQTFWEKTDSVKKFMLDLSDEFNVKQVFVEENLQKFRPGFSSAKTLTTLAKMNGIVSFIAHDIFNVIPFNVKVNSARKVLGIEINRKAKTYKTKQQVFDQVRDRIKYDWPQKVLRGGPNKGKTIFDNSCYDMADAWVVCKAGQLLSY